MTTYHYFFHYHVPFTGGYGNGEHTTEEPILNYAPIRKLQEQLKAERKDPVGTELIIDNIVLLGTSE